MSAWTFFEGDHLFVPAAHRLTVGESSALCVSEETQFGLATMWCPQVRLSAGSNAVQGEACSDLVAAKRAAIELLSSTALAEVTRLHAVARACNALLAAGEAG